MPKRIEIFALLLVLASAGGAAAHDTGFGHSRRTMFLAAAPGELILEYRITQNLDEALIELATADQDGDGEISAAEKDRHFSAVADQLALGLQFRTAGGQTLRPTFASYRLQNSLTQTFRFTIATDSSDILLEDGNFPHKPGQVRIVTGQGIKAEPSEPVDLSHADWLSLTITRKVASQ